MKFFIYDKSLGSVVLNNEGLLVIKEFAALMDLNRNKTKTDKTGKNRELAFREFQYIYLFLDWESPYFNVVEQLRHEAALEDSGLTQEEFNNPEFRAACKKYEEIQNSNISVRLLKSAMNSVETVIYYLDHVDVNERGEDGKPLIKTKDLIAEIKGCKDLVVSIKELEKQVKKEIESESSLRGGAEGGYYD